VPSIRLPVNPSVLPESQSLFDRLRADLHKGLRYSQEDGLSFIGRTRSCPIRAGKDQATVDQIDHQLREWIAAVCEDVQVSLEAPRRDEDGEGIGLYLMELVHAPPGRGSGLAPLRVTLRYLVTAWAGEPVKAHSLLGQLVFAAMEREDCEVELEPLSAPMWLALGVAPRPSFILRVPLERQRVERKVPRVRTRLTVHQSPMRPLHGQVLGPGDVGIMGAQVTLPALNLVVSTDFKGRFRFPAVPTQPPITRLRVCARGQETPVLVDPAGVFTPESPLIIHLNPMEL
jgi:hypothetical protein